MCLVDSSGGGGGGGRIQSRQIDDMEGGPFVALNMLRDRGGSYVQWLKNTLLKKIWSFYTPHSPSIG
jgi:hypothetical protein